MPIFKIAHEKAEQLDLKQEAFGNEAKLRDFFAANLEEILGVRFLENEYRTTDGRIDTLGIDEDNNPVIIEYKWKENEEVLSQGLFYLDWLLKNKSHFELLVRSKFGVESEISWDQPRVILIARGFSRYVKAAVQRTDNVELKSYSLYNGDILQLESEYSPRPERQSVRRIILPEEDHKEVYDLNYHLNLASPEMKECFMTLRERLLQLPESEEVSEQKSGITYRTTKSFTRFEFKGNWIQLLLREPSYPMDKSSLVKDVTTHKWGYKGKVKFTPESEVEEIYTLINASYESTL
jgi:predicted transport protein